MVSAQQRYADEPAWLQERRKVAAALFFQKEMPNFVYGLNMNLNIRLNLENDIDITQTGIVERQIISKDPAIVIAELPEILKNHEITGYTTYEVDGNGARGLRGQGFKNEKNVKVEVIMREEKLSDIVEEISRTLFANFAIVLYVSDIDVVRTEKF